MRVKKTSTNQVLEISHWRIVASVFAFRPTKIVLRVVIPIFAHTNVIRLLLTVKIGVHVFKSVRKDVINVWVVFANVKIMI